jgi:hypothetical protein
MFSQINQYIQLLEKFFFVVGTVLYTIFALVVVKQTTMMSKNVSDKLNYILILFSYLHLLFSVLLVIMAILLL